MKLKTFGKIAESIPDGAKIEAEIRTVKDLKIYLETTYPVLRELTYSVAVERKIASEEEALPAGAEVALMPPFSGG